MREILLCIFFIVINISFFSNEMPNSDDNPPKIFDLKNKGDNWYLVTEDKQMQYGYYQYEKHETGWKINREYNYSNRSYDTIKTTYYTEILTDFTESPFLSKGDLNLLLYAISNYKEALSFTLGFGLSFGLTSACFIIGGVLEYFMPNTDFYKSNKYYNGIYIGLVGGLIGGLLGLITIGIFIGMIMGYYSYYTAKKLFIKKINQNVEEKKSSSIKVKFDMRFSMN